MSNEHRDFDFHALWRENIERYAPKSPAPSIKQESCDLAEEFARKVEELIFTALGASPSLSQLAQGKFLLQEEWQAWRRATPNDHRGEARTARHRCVDEAYHAAYDRLNSIHLRFFPPVNPIASYDQMAGTAATPAKKPRRSPPGRVLFGDAE